MDRIEELIQGKYYELTYDETFYGCMPYAPKGIEFESSGRYCGILHDRSQGVKYNVFVAGEYVVLFEAK